MAQFGFLLMLAGALTQVVLSGGPLVLGYFVVIGALPFFTVPMGLYMRLARMAQGLASALFPLVSELEGQRDDVTLDRLFVSGTRCLLLAGVSTMAPAVLLAGPFLTLWMGGEFAAQAGRPLEALFAAFVVAVATVPSIELARGTGRSGLLVAYTAVQAVINLSAVALLAPALGATGAGVAFLLTQTVGFAFLAVKVGGRGLRGVLSPAVLLVSCSACLGTLGGLVFITSPWGRLLCGTALGVAVASASFAWALTTEEQRAIRRMLVRP
jgi:O-antigen/teichoic acid export membrane protein